MKYSVNRTNLGMTFECLDGGFGSTKPRLVRRSQGMPILAMLDALWNRGHLTYLLRYKGVDVSPLDWSKMAEDKDFLVKDLEIVADSDLDVVTLCGYAMNVATGTGRAHGRIQPKYSRPTSKKSVQMSWLYQHGTELVTAE